MVDLGHVQLNTKTDGPEGAPWIVLSNSLGSNLGMWGHFYCYNLRWNMYRFTDPIQSIGYTVSQG